MAVWFISVGFKLTPQKGGGQRRVSMYVPQSSLDQQSSQSNTASFPGQALHEPKLLHFGGPYRFNGLEWLEMNGWTLLRAPRSREAALVAGRGPNF